MKKILSLTLALLMILTMLPMSVFASGFDGSVSDNYFTVISEDKYSLAPGATETEMVLNNADGNDRKVVHYFEVDTSVDTIQVMPGYYGIDKLDPDNLPLDGVSDKSEFWKAEQLTKTVAYYENLGYNVVGAMNTALAYDSNAPYGYMVWDGVVLGTPEVHKGAQTYLAINYDGSCELRSMTTPLTGNEKTAISANFGWLVKDGALVSKTVERTSSDASRSMIGIKEDGTIVFCQVDGRNAPFSTGLSNYEMGEMMLSIGCVNAVNCDGGGSSTFVSKREGETENVMRSVPSDGSERATINSAIIVTTAVATGIFDHAVLESEYNYYAPYSSATITGAGVDTNGYPMDIPTQDITWKLADSKFGTVADGVFTSNGTKGDVTVQMVYEDKVVGEKTIHVVDPDVFALAYDAIAIPHGESVDLEFACTYGADDYPVFMDGSYTISVDVPEDLKISEKTLTATTDTTKTVANITVTYTPDSTKKDSLFITLGEATKTVFDFEDGDVSDWMGFDEAKQWSIDNEVNNTLVGSDPLAGQYSYFPDSNTFLASKENGGQVKNGKYSLAWSLDNTSVDFSNWTYNVLFYVGAPKVLRDVANGNHASSLGMWLYIPEGATGLAFQSQLYVKNENGSLTCKQAHFTFRTKNGTVKNLNSCSEADIPESRWVWASIDLTAYDYISTCDPTDTTNSRSPSIVRTYVKPEAPAIHTFYIDDISLDYSPAVDDRQAPSISEMSYAVTDTAVAINDGDVINSNNITLSAIVTDNAKLDSTSGKIYIDGVEINNVSISGKYLTSGEVNLTSGAHKITFEAKDALGNTVNVSRNVTIAGDPVITLSGHNESGATPVTGSVYYVDVNAGNVANVKEINTVLKLNTAHKWEPAGITVADGFDVTYSVNEPDGLLNLKVTRNNEEVDASATNLVSIPVRVWSWDGINHITGEKIASESHYATKNCPTVNVDYKVVRGAVEFVSEYKDCVGAFGGSVSVDTMIKDITNPWHYHDEELTALNAEGSCTEAGYTGRTYCETCKSVVDWGTVIPATGHSFDINGKCSCGASNTFTGLLEKDGNWYYYINGVAASGWQMIGTDWYYFDTDTRIGADGDVEIGVVTYNFKDGKLTSGVWAKTLFGYRYYYGPGFYNDRGSWREIDGKNYYFEKGIRLEGGWQLVFENQKNKNWYYFNEDGTCDKTVKPEDGFYTDRNGLAYAKNGEGLAGLQVIDGKNYYFDSKGYAKNNGTYANVLFKEDYAAYTGFVEKDGVLYLYENGRTATNGLYKIDGDYYYSYWGGVVKTDGRYYISNSFCDLPAGNYSFDKNGKMLNGVVEQNGETYLYINGSTAQNGLYEVDGDYYYSYWGGELQTDGRYYVSKSYCDLPAGNYTFDENGKMLDGVVDVDGTLYLYQNGTTATCGLFEVDGEYYYSYWGGVLQTDGRYYVTRTYCDLPVGNYTFGPDGKMLDGVVDVDGTLYLYQNGSTATCGLFEVDGEYYYSYWGGVLQTDGRYYVTRTYCDLPVGNYTFGADGKMLNGVVDIDGTLYLYQNGSTATNGLYEIDGDYYYSYWGGVLKTDGRYYIGNTNCDLPAGNYTFDADGKMLNGFVTIGDTIYYYENGNTPKPGIIEVDGDYYFVNWGGVVVTNQKFFVFEGNGYTIKMNYTFDQTGKIVG